jgi:hypothetical protein
MFNSTSLALKALLSRLPGSCRVGGVRLILFCHMLPPIGEELTEGDIGGVEVLGSIREDDPRDSGLNIVTSNEFMGTDFGEGTPEPVEA